MKGRLLATPWQAISRKTDMQGRAPLGATCTGWLTRRGPSTWRLIGIRRGPGSNATSPAGGAGEGATGARVPGRQPIKGAVTRPTGCLSAPASAAFLHPAASCGRTGAGRDQTPRADVGSQAPTLKARGLTPVRDPSVPAMCLSAVTGSAPLLALRRKRSQRDAWSLSPSRSPSRRRPPAREGRMAPPTSRRSRRPRILVTARGGRR
jgi:hypothetical protein